MKTIDFRRLPIVRTFPIFYAVILPGKMACRLVLEPVIAGLQMHYPHAVLSQLELILSKTLRRLPSLKL